MNSCLIIAGEMSGEEHCLSFYPELSKGLSDWSFFGVGGDRLRELGVNLVYHLKDFSSWGYSEVIGKIPFYAKATEALLEDVKNRNCRHAILVDFQTFNMRLAKKLKKMGIQVHFIVAPQAWAWKPWRVKQLSSSVETLYTIIPFEKKWFKDRGVNEVISIDHPVFTKYREELESYKREKLPLNKKNKEFKILLLPGSRNFEVSNLLPIFINTIKKLKESVRVHLSIVQSENVDARLYNLYKDSINLFYESKDVTKAIKAADLCLAASGTVTLTCGLFQLPTVVCYKTSLLNQLIFEFFVNYKGPISLNNIVHERRLFPELVQDDLEESVLLFKLKEWIDDPAKYNNLIDDLDKTKSLVRGECSNLAEHFFKKFQNTNGATGV